MTIKKIAAKTKNIFLNSFRSFKKSSLKKKLFLIILFLIFIGVAAYRINIIFQPPPYTLTQVEKADITETVSETGNITSGGGVNVHSPTSGIITDVFVANGDNVSENQELFKVKSSATEQEQQLAYSNYLTAQSTLNAAKSTENSLRADMYGAWKSFRDLATNSTYENSDQSPRTSNREAAEFQISQDDWIAAEKKYKDQQTAISQGQALVASTWLSYQATQDSTVKATIDGIVSNLSAKNGSTITANSALSPQTPILVITNGTISEAVISVSETDVTKIKPGQEAKVTVDAISNKTFKSVVERVDNIGTKTQGVIGYNVYIKLLDQDENLKGGMSMDAEITTEKLTGVLSVPNSAVKPYQGGKAVRVSGTKKGDIKYIPVIIGVRGKDRTQILKGLTEGQQIITTLSNEKIKRPGLFGS